MNNAFLSDAMCDFSQKIVFITGAAGGIGAALARGFASVGANLILHDKNEEALTKLSQELHARMVVADFLRPDDVEAMLQTVLRTEKCIHVLINNAGIEVRKPYEEFSMDEYDAVMNVNLRSIFQLTKGLFPLLKEGGGASVINMSSIHQELAYPSNLPYSMAKAALGMFAKIVGVEWAPYNIRVNNLAPGAIETPMNKDRIDEIGRGIFSSWIGSGKIGSVENVLKACFFLASDMSSYMTAETLVLDGALSKGLLPYGQTPAMKAMIEKLRTQDGGRQK